MLHDLRFATRTLGLTLIAAASAALAVAAADPYPSPDRAAADLQHARQEARASGKMLMVIFGGNWCPDCRVLHQRLDESPVREYVAQHFVIVGINIGQMDANLNVADELGVTLKRGVPAAAIFDSRGKPVGFTNQGELEPARQYSAQQVLTFLRNVAEKRLIEKPK
jgi:thioredoxin-related protein